jgi:hypothetical protein
LNVRSCKILFGKSISTFLDLSMTLNSQKRLAQPKQNEDMRGPTMAERAVLTDSRCYETEDIKIALSKNDDTVGGGMNDLKKSIETNGFFLSKNRISQVLVNKLKIELEAAIEKETKYHKSKTHKDHGMVLVCAQYGGELLKTFDNKELFSPMEELLGENLIVYSNTSTSMPPNSGNYSSRVHRDTSDGIEMLNNKLMALIILDDFTEQNGATWLLPKSHLFKEAPNEEYFYKNAERVIASAGSVLYWRPHIYHAGGVNKTDKWRHALTIVACKPNMKQRIDLPRLLETKIDINTLTNIQKKRLGFLDQPPISYDEYYSRGLK